MNGSRRDWVIAGCTAKPAAVEDYPFGDEVAVFKVAGRVFALVPLGEEPGSVSLFFMRSYAQHGIFTYGC